MRKIIICGTDVHEKTLVSRIAQGKDKGIEKEHPNTHTGRERLIKDLKSLAREHKAERIVLAYESSTLGYRLHDECKASGIESYVLAPSKMVRAQKDRKKKTDREDARRIFEILRGHLLAGNDLPSIWIPDDETRDGRELVRQRVDIGDKITTIKTQVQMLLKRHGIIRPEGIKEAWTKKYRGWLRILPLAKGAKASLMSLIRQLKCFEEERELLDREMIKLSQEKRYRQSVESLVTEIKGVGILTAMVYLTEMGDLRRFCNRREIGSFLGLIPSSNESGERDNRKGHITRQGPKRIRKVLCQATWARVAHDANEKKVYDRIIEKNPKHKKIGVVASMRRLGIRMWHIALETQIKSKAFENIKEAA